MSTLPDKHHIYFVSLNPIHFTPYAYGLLRCYADQYIDIKKKYHWHDPITELNDIAAIARQIIKPDILCASCYIWNHNQHLQIAHLIKQNYPDCLVIFGGPHIPNNSETYFSKHPYVDILVHSEGEIPFAQILNERLKPNADFTQIGNLTVNRNKKALKTHPINPLPKNLPVESPYLKGLFNNFLENAGKKAIALWETNRGCPFHCTFCDWGVRTNNKLRLHDLSKIDQEISFFAQNRIADIYITDCNFGIFKRDLEITEKLIRAKQTYGYPKRIRIQFAKNTDDMVFEISRRLHRHDMLWGTTLSTQSMDTDVVNAIKRRFTGFKNFKQIKQKYVDHGIPTYTELILGLPMETRDSFINGICNLLDAGVHDDIRIYELVLLPNAPISAPESRQRYGLKTKFKPLRLTDNPKAREYAEIVFETQTMSYNDWAYCFLFGEMIQALHNGGYTRFVAIYLNEHKHLSYRDFYDNLLAFMQQSDANCFKAVKRLSTLIHDFYQNPDMPQINRILTQKDMMAFLGTYNSKRKGWPLWSYLWVSLSESIGEFYRHLKQFLVQSDVVLDSRLNDLLRFQQEIMLTPAYDPQVGKKVRYAYNWFDYFFNHDNVKEESQSLWYRDTHMGITFKYELEKNNRYKFLSAAIGISYPYTKYRHFFHQPDKTSKTGLTDAPKIKIQTN